MRNVFIHNNLISTIILHGDKNKTKIYWVEWSKVVVAKKDGSFGIALLKAQNIEVEVIK